MGLLDQVLGGLRTSGVEKQLVQTVGGLLGSGSAVGGLSGLLGALESKGLGGIGQSWVSTGKNLPISAQQLQGVLGEEHVAAIAQKLGITPDKAAAGLSKLLPKLVDQVTPDGKAPDAGALEGALKKLL
jgi:uncharacterized protein YidB (DUF937 family)